MLDLILDTARQDERIRAVVLNGSRANPNGPRDIFQDFDVIYLVTDVEPFKADPHWHERFGEMMVMQLPDAMPGEPPRVEGEWGYLMQFMDGNRIDLTLMPLKNAPEALEDAPSRVLLDKNGLFASLDARPAREPEQPDHRAFADCCNEFWWCAPYVAKGLWRNQVTYAKGVLEQFMRPQLTRMLSWHAGLQGGCNAGYLGKHLRDCLDAATYDELMHTYTGPAIADTWEALFAMCRLFRRVALPVARQYGFEYPHTDDTNVSTHLMNVQLLPPDATEIY